MSTVLSIARNETRRIFVSPLAWTMLGVFQFIVAMAFVKSLDTYAMNAEMGDRVTGVSDYLTMNVYGFASVIGLFVIPLLTMRTFAEERKSQSLTLLLSAPVSLIEIVLGKFFAVLVFVLAAAALLAVQASVLMFGTHLDLGKVAAGLLGFVLMLGAFGASGLFASTLTREPTIAALLGFAIALVVWISSMFQSSPGWLGQLVGYLSLITHYDSLSRGVFNSADVVYYLLFTVFFLWLAVLRLDIERS
ncbi:MAG: ABC transporter permease subunit [Nevskia sp.]|nr:ABC transporter permease subunit [Nevskia sp.]